MTHDRIHELASHSIPASTTPLSVWPQVGGGVNVYGVDSLVKQAISAQEQKLASPLLNFIHAPHSKIAQVSRGCIVSRLLQVCGGLMGLVEHVIG